MAFCGKCGAPLEEGVELCQECDNKEKEVETPVAAATATAPAASEAPGQDAQTNKTMAILAYIVLIPLFTGDYKKSPFVKFHLNQGITLYGMSIAYSIISTIIQSLVKVQREVVFFGVRTGSFYKATPGWLVAIFSLGSIFFTVLWIIGIVNAVKGQKKPLPLIGGITFLK